jgi:3-oxoacyl-[acyl-carrier protein] reductase
MQLTFSNERVLILGGTSQIGLALAQRLVAVGIKPVLAWRRERSRKAALERLTARAASVPADDFVHLEMREKESAETLFHRCGPPPDALVDLAQGDLEALVGSVDPARLELFVKAHLTHRALILRQAARNFLNRGQGRALLVSTTAAGRPKPGQGFYAAVKRGAEALYRNLGVELGSRGITAVTLRPGYVDAGRGRVYLSAVPDALAGVPTGRALTPGEVADALVFLLSDNARSFNATELTMDGGLTATK